MIARNHTKQTLIADALDMATGFVSRMRGLLGTRPLESGRGLYIAPCKQVHSFGMGYLLDLILLDSNHHVVDTITAFAPRRISPRVRSACGVLELPVGTIARSRTEAGDIVALEKRRS